MSFFRLALAFTLAFIALYCDITTQASPSVPATRNGLEDSSSVEAFGVPLSGWFPVNLIDSGKPGRGRQLVSRTRYRCMTSVANTSVTNVTATLDEPGTDLRLECLGGDRFVEAEQLVAWNTIMAPGLYDTASIVSQREAALSGEAITAPTLRCATYSCEDPPFRGHDGDGAALDRNLTGGLSPATPCCASRHNTTFLLRTAPANAIVQMSTLPFLVLANASVALMRAAWCDTDTDADASSSSQSNAAPANCTASMGHCLIRLLDPRFFFAQTASSAWNGDGGLTFPVAFDMCGATISNVFDLRRFELISQNLHAVITTTEHVDGLTLPSELIRGVLSWIAVFDDQGRKQTGSLDSRQLCEWGNDPAQASTYRTGEFVDCLLPTALIGTLPPLMLSVPRDRLFSSGVAEFQPLVSLCRFALDLNQLIDPDTGILRLHSSGSFSDAVRSTQRIVSFREPLVVIGAMFLRGATIGVSRTTSSHTSAAALSRAAATATSSSPSSDFDSAWRGLPLLYIAAYSPGNTTSGVESTCAASDQPTCILEDKYYASVNRCVAVRCIGVLGYDFNSDTLTCGPNIVLVSVLSFFAFMTAVVEVFFLLVHRRTEKAKYEHLNLVEEAQRKKKQ